MSKYMSEAQLAEIENRKNQICEMSSKDISALVENIYHSIPEDSDRWSWHRGYMQSMVSQRSKSQGLSPKQIYYVAKIELEIKAAPAEAEKENTFKKRYLSTPEMRENVALAVAYYQKSGYWSNLINDYTKNQDNHDWAPSERVYTRAIANNKFVQRYLEELRSPKKYSIGQMITLRSNSTIRSSSVKCESQYTPGRFVNRIYREGDLFMVMNYDQNDVEPKRGGKALEILCVGTNEILRTRESDIKKVKVKK